MAGDSSEPIIRVGTAGWSIPAAVRDGFPDTGSHLERYATRLNAVEINSSFYRPHRRATYQRWAASVPTSFRFAVKLPKVITHERRLIGTDDLLARFADEIAGLEDRLGPVLIQLPPSLAFDSDIASRFFARVGEILGGTIVCEPRHASWFAQGADDLLAACRVGRVAADPARVPIAAVPGGWAGLRYTRLHGSPEIYRSEYDSLAIERHAGAAREAAGAHWTIYDNTAEGFATANALDLARRLADRRD